MNTPPAVIRNAARETALREIDSQREQFKPLGIMADWDSKERTYRTLGRSLLHTVGLSNMNLEFIQTNTMLFVNYVYFKRWSRKVKSWSSYRIVLVANTYFILLTGLIYRQHRPVHYSPSSRSALAEAELVYKDDHVSHSVYVPFDIDTSSLKQDPVLHAYPRVQLLVWTTTPWTLSANMV